MAVLSSLMTSISVTSAKNMICVPTSTVWLTVAEIYAFVPVVIANVPFASRLQSVKSANLLVSRPDWKPKCLNRSKEADSLIIETVSFIDFAIISVVRFALFKATEMRFGSAVT